MSSEPTELMIHPTPPMRNYVNGASSKPQGQGAVDRNVAIGDGIGNNGYSVHFDEVLKFWMDSAWRMTFLTLLELSTLTKDDVSA